MMERMNEADMHQEPFFKERRNSSVLWGCRACGGEWVEKTGSWKTRLTDPKDD